MLDAPIYAWCIAAVAQGTVGYLQYWSGVPAGLVAVHVAGATTLWGITVWLACSTTPRDADRRTSWSATTVTGRRRRRPGRR